MTYLFLLTHQICLELIQSANQKLLKWVFYERCQICMLKDGMRGLTFPRKKKQYQLFKDNLNFEKYLINVSNFYCYKIIKYKTGNHRPPVETGRRDDTPLNVRKWNVCTTNDVGDEYHYLFHVTF